MSGAAGDPMEAVERAWVLAYGPVTGRGSMSFIGVPPMVVLRFGPDPAGVVRYATLGMSREPMGDPGSLVVTGSGPRAELVLELAGARDSVLRSMAVLASAPAVEGLVLAPDATVETGAPLWDGAQFTAILVDPPVLPDATVGASADAVRLLPVVPITAVELAYRRARGAAALRSAWAAAGIDLHAVTRGVAAGFSDPD